MRERIWNQARACIVAAGVVLMAAAPLYAQTDPPPVTSSDRIGWDQAAADATELASYQYRVYLDGATTGTVLADVQCATAPTNGLFACSAAWPASTPGSHTLTLTAFAVVDGQTYESAPSEPFAYRLIFAPSAPQNLRRQSGTVQP